MELSKQRIGWIDTARGMLIILVVLGHGCTNAAFNMIINSFHMAAYFMLSGFTLKVSERTSIFIWKKCKRLIFPYFVFAIIMLVYQFAKTFIFRDAVFDLKGGLLSMFILVGGREPTTTYGLWFLPCLFLADIESYIIVRMWDKAKPMSIIVFLGVLVLGVRSYLLSSRYTIIEILPIATFFVLFGYILKEKQVLYKKSWILLVLSLFLFTVFTLANWIFYIDHFRLDTVDLSHMRLGGWPLYLLSSIFGSIMIYELALILEKSEFLAFLGRDSLYYYGLHYEIFGAVGKIIPGVIPQTIVTFLILCPVIQLYKKTGLYGSILFFRI